MKKVLIFLVLTIVAVTTLKSQVYTPQQMPNVNKENRYHFVSDPAGLLSPEATKIVNEKLWNLRQETTAEAVVAIPPSIGDMPIEEFSEKLFTAWGIGKSDKDNGVLLVISPESRRVRIQTGYGVEGILPDIVCKNIIDRAVVPNMQRDDLSAAVIEAVNDICGAMTDPSVREELKSEQLDNYSGNINALSPDVIRQFVYIIAICAFIFALFMFCYYLWSLRKRTNYEKSLKWKQLTPTFWWTALFSVGSAVPFALLALWLSRSYRNKKLNCPTCGHKMNKLAEDEDNELLSPSQDFEEQIRSVDYDVWECPQCGTIERFPFRENQKKYSECPDCGTVAMCLKSRRTLVPATERYEGKGENIYECEFCHHQKRTMFTIPRKESAALAAAAALGAMSSGRGGSSGGGFGGGFGGGSTGGGGASGGW